MKRFSLALAIVVFPILGGVALADCPPGTYSVTLSDGGTGFSVSFDEMVAIFGSPVSCQLAVTTNVPAGFIAAYRASYRGFMMDPTATAGIRVQHNGVTDHGVVPDDFFYTHIIGSDAAGEIESQIALELLTGDPAGNAELIGLDYNELARTTTSDIQASVEQFAASRTSLITHLNATADLLSGAGQKFEREDGVEVIGGVGSFTAGLMGRRSLDAGFSVLGGAALFGQSAGGASATGMLFSGSLRYLTPGSDPIRPFGEIGIRSAPVLQLSFSRQTKTSSGAQTGTGSGLGMTLGGYVKGGVLYAPDPSNEIVFSATLAKDWLHIGNYSESLTTSNLFALGAPDATSSFDTVKAGVDWTTAITPQLDLTLSAAIGRTIAENPVAANVAFAGGFSGMPRSENFAEYGVRVAYALDAANELGVFIHGSTGEYSGTHAQVGGDFHVRF